MRAIKVYCPPGAEPPLYAFIDALDGKLKANIGSIQCDGKAYIPEVEMAPTQYCASAPFHSLYLY